MLKSIKEIKTQEIYFTVIFFNTSLKKLTELNTFFSSQKKNKL